MKSLFNSTNRLFLRDTPFASLMNKRVFNVLLIATPYDAFMLEDDGRVDEQIFNEYTSLNLRYPPRFTQAFDEEEALRLLSDRHFELIIVMPNLTNANTFSAANRLQSLYPDIPIVVLTPFSKEVSKRLKQTDLSHIDYVFSWLGNTELLVAIIKLIEDRLNAPHDVSEVGVQTILLVEDSVRFYSSALPLLYRLVLEQSREFAKEALNDHLQTLRMRGRPKIMLARSYEEAIQICQNFADNMLGVISDMAFTRNGRKDSQAGFRLAQQLRKSHPHLPIILESSDAEALRYADILHLPFIQKSAKSYPQDLEREVMHHFGFGDFVVADPHTHEEILRIRNLKELQDNLPRIPDEVLFHHLCNNHISRFLYSRAIFPPAEILRKHDAHQYKNMNEARAFILQLIAAYRQMKNAGVVAVYQKDRFDQFGQFARIGNGSMGGKGRGLAFINHCLWQEEFSLDKPLLHVQLPKTVIICTDVFSRFMLDNQLYPIALSQASDEEILEAFLQSSLSADVIDDLLHLLRNGSSPIAVRSSSLLEDSHYQPFAGVYSTYMVPRSSSLQETLLHVQAAIKAVYASVFYRNSKNYLSATQNLIDQEKMAIVLQEVVGTEQADGLYYPSFSGVAQSVNYYPVGKQRAEDGVVSLAVGLGKQIVDGEKSLRFSPTYPKHQMQLSDPQTALRETQSAFWAVDLHQASSLPTCHDDTYLRNVPLQKFSTSDEASPYLFSTFDHANDRIISGCYPEQGRLIASFSALLHSPVIPLAATIQELLRMGQRNMGRPVEIEMAIQMNGLQSITLYLLQIRPMVDIAEDTGGLTPIRTEGHTLLLSASQTLGNGLISDISHIVYLPSTSYSASQSLRWAQQLAEINEHFVRNQKTYLLIGAGRWGTSDASMGIPVSWSQISAAAAIVELPITTRHIDASQGSHFFHNLTSLGIPYLTLNEHDLSLFNKEWFAQHANSSEEIQLITLKKPLLISIDGRRSKGKIFEN